MLSIGLVGATNVGKSTLFNRLIKQYRAIVTNIAGTTTDIVRQTSELKGIGKVSFVDSPGLLDFTEEWVFIKQIIDEEDLLLFVIDDSVGITAKEQHIFSYIMEQNKKQNTILVINKLDVNHSEKDYDLALAEYYSLGFEHVIGVSAKKEKNIGEIIDAIKEVVHQLSSGSLSEESTTHTIDSSAIASEGQEVDENMIKLAIVGKPNAGKSTLLNQITKQYLAKVEDKAGTTRDYIVGDFERKGQQFTIYDTAGIKKKGKIHGIERIAYEKIKKMLQYVRPIVIFMIDIAAGISHRDLTLLAEIEHMGLPLIIGLNKIDLLEEKNKNTLQSIKTHLKIAKYIPVVPMSALHGDGKERLLNMVSKVHVENTKRIDTNELNSMISHERLQRPPRFAKNKVCKILYITQVDIDAPTFMIFVNHSKRINFALKRWIEN
ncbi:MAG: ribosome biogenesis GTPase Der, partial [candidate division SR1 bacterium]